MRAPRCGVADITDPSFQEIPRRWPKTHLTWDFRLANADTLWVAKRAFDLWAANSSLTFTRSTQDPDILISFRSRDNANAARSINGDICPWPLDGPGTVLAHAYGPSGDFYDVAEVHMDSEEPWYISVDENPSNTLSLLTTLTHEIGHSLGLKHSQSNDSIMFAFMMQHKFPIELQMEDILAIQSLYGVVETYTRRPDSTTTTTPATTSTTTKSTTTTTTTTTSPATSTPTTDVARPNYTSHVDLCDLQRLDVALILNRRMYIAYRRDLWSISLSEKIYSDPLQLTDYVKFLPTHFQRLSAAYQRPSGDLLLFVGDSIYMIDNLSFTLRSGWPKSLKDIGLP